MDLSTRLLRAFVTVAEEESFTRAAQRLYLTQQALSVQIRRLEEVTRTRLFDRTTRSVALTAAGEALLPAALRVLAATEQAEEALRLVVSGHRGVLRVGFLAGAALELTASVLADFQQRRPDIALRLTERPFTDPSAGLAGGSSDVAFIRPPCSTPDLLVEQLLAEPRVVVVPDGHRLAGRDGVRLADLDGEPLIGTTTVDETWDAFWLGQDARPAGQAPAVVHRVSSLEEELTLVRAGQGLSITAASAGRWAPRPGLQYLPVTDLAPTTVAVSWRQDRVHEAVPDFVAACLRARTSATADASATYKQSL